MTKVSLPKALHTNLYGLPTHINTLLITCPPFSSFYVMKYLLYMI